MLFSFYAASFQVYKSLLQGENWEFFGKTFPVTNQISDTLKSETPPAPLNPFPSSIHSQTCC